VQIDSAKKPINDSAGFLRRPVPLLATGSIYRSDRTIELQVTPLTSTHHKRHFQLSEEIAMNLLCARTLALCLLAGMLAGVSGCKGSVAQGSGSGSADEKMSGPPTFNATYQVRNPRVCAKVTSPPTPAQAKALVQCSNESDTTGSSYPAIVVATDLQVEMGAPRDYIAGTDGRGDLDPSAKIYPLRGQGTRWSCGPASAYAPGENCMKWPAGPGGVGGCWKTAFGDWQCNMSIGGTNYLTKQKGPTDY
jgi:hypothetical protein